MIMCYANPYMKTVFDALIQEHKRIIIISNMYYPAEMLEKILANCGYVGYEKLFVSCDYKLNKRGGGLFRYVRENYLTNGESVIHIGDSEGADMEGAKEAGWDTHYYEINTKMKRSFCRGNMSYLYGSYYNAVVNNYLRNRYNRHEELDKRGRFYTYGFKYGGPFVLGYVNFIHKYCMDHQMDKVLFLSRDGHFLKQIYDELYSDIPSEYVLWSRSAMVRTMPHIYLKDLFQQTVARRLESANCNTVEGYLNDMNLQELVDVLDVPKDTVVTAENLEDFYLFLEKHLGEIRKISHNTRKAAYRYLEPFVRNCGKVAIVDIGWRGSGAISLKKLYNELWGIPCEITGIVAGNTKHTRMRDTSLAVCGSIVSYMFSEIHNRDIANHFAAKASRYMPLFEIIGGSCSMPSFLGFQWTGDDYELEFDVPEIGNYKIIEGLHSGERDFVHEYIVHAKCMPQLLDIPGRDAYVALMQVFEDKQALKDFGQYLFPRNIGGTVNQNIFETLDDIWAEIDGKEKKKD